MIFGRLAPWHNKRQQTLCRASFHTNESKALLLANDWLKSYALDSIAYPEHRLLVRMANRFPNAEFQPSDAGRIAGLKRQIWARGHINLKTAMPALAALESFEIPWVLCGAAQWFVQPDIAKQQSADFIEFTVPDKARSAALHVLAQNGWRQDWSSREAKAGPVYTSLSKGQGALRLSKASALFTYAPDGEETMWSHRVVQNHLLGKLYIPDRIASLAMAIGKSHAGYLRDDQWVFDLFNLDPSPLDLLKSISGSSRRTQTLLTFLNSRFYR